jgi:hypothetical protein
MTVCSKDRISIPFFVLFLGLFLLVSCRKNEDTVGSDFVGAIVGFNVQSSDTASVVAYTSVHDSLFTNKLSYFMLGSMNDPEIGTTKTAIATQVELPYNEFPLFTTLTIDSIVLQLTYATPTSALGNKSSVQTIRVYELNEDLPTTGLYSNKVYATYATPLGTWTSNYTHLGDSVPLTLNGQTVNLAPHVRIKLDESSFVAKFKNAGAAEFKTSSAFKAYMKGLYIVPETNPASGEGAIAYMNLYNPTSSLVIYYNGISKAEFPIFSSNSLKGNAFSHSYLPAVAIQPAMGGTHQNTCYVQPAAGLKTRITFPYLFDFAKNKNIAITGAEVVVSVDQTKDTSVYKLPGWMLLNTSDSTGKYDFPLDLYTSDGIYYYDGYYNGTRGEYRFNIQRQVQSWFNQYKNNGRNVNYGLNLIVPADNPVGANRVILDSRAGKIKLKLSYTVIK